MPSQLNILRQKLAEKKITQQQFDAKVAAYRAKREAKRKARGPPTYTKKTPNAQNSTTTALVKQPFPRRQRRGQAPPIPPKPTKAARTAAPLTSWFSGLSAEDKGTCLQYALALIGLCDDAKIPSAEARKTATFCTTTEFPIFASFDGLWAGKNAGRWTVCLQPILGSPTSVNTYKVALTDGTLPGWPTEWSDPAAYVSLQAEADIRIDPNSQTMTQAPGMFFNGQGDQATANEIIPFGNTLTPNLTYGAQVIMTAAITGNEFRMPPGNYYVNISCVATAPGSVWGLVTATALGGALVSTITFQTTSGGAEFEAEYFVYVYASNSGFTLTSTGGSPAPSVIDSDISVISTFYEPLTSDTGSAMPPNISQGIISEMRPVAMSALMSFIASPAFTGGDVVAAYVGAGATDQNFFNTVVTSSVGVGQLQYWEQLGKTPDKYDGKEIEGCWAYWTPQDVNDTVFQVPNASNETMFPAIIMSGQVTLIGATTPVGPQLIGRLTMKNVYEFVSLGTVFPQTNTPGSTQDFEAVMRTFLGKPHCFANDQHDSFRTQMWNLFKAAGLDLGKALLSLGTKAALGALVAL